MQFLLGEIMGAHPDILPPLKNGEACLGLMPLRQSRNDRGSTRGVGTFRGEDKLRVASLSPMPAESSKNWGSRLYQRATTWELSPRGATSRKIGVRLIPDLCARGRAARARGRAKRRLRAPARLRNRQPSHRTKASPSSGSPSFLLLSCLLPFISASLAVGTHF